MTRAQPDAASPQRARRPRATAICPVCASIDTRRCWHTLAAPVLCNRLCDSPEQAREVPRAAIDLHLCRRCALCFNRAFDPGLIEYAGDYDNTLHHAAAFRRYQRALTRYLLCSHNLHGKRVFEIGAGDGSFLRQLAAAGANHARGIDPAAAPVDESLENGGHLQLIAEPFAPEQVADFAPDLLCCRHTLEHIADPVSFLTELRRALPQHAAVYFEVPNFRYTLEHEGIWDLIYEHCTYFTVESITNLFTRAGYTPLRVRTAYRSQFLCIQATPAAPEADTRPAPGASAGTLLGSVEAFHRLYQARLNRARAILQRIAEADERAVLWGAGSKGVTFLNTLAADHAPIVAAVDQNPRKQNHYIPGTAQPIIAPEDLPGFEPQYVIVPNPIYRREIAQHVAGLNHRARILSI